MKKPDVESTPSFSALAETLRRQFDDAFTRPAELKDGSVERLVVVRAGSASVAVRLTELAGLHVLPDVTELPGDVPFRLGICGIGGRPVPVFDLAGLLGNAVSDERHRIVLVANAETVGFACHQLVGQVDLPASQVRTILPGDATGSFTIAIASTVGGGLPVLSLRRAVERISPANIRPEER